jgi:pimeloyl-ACP methyl ester carboxylesterase
VRVRLWHGSADQFSPVEHTRWLAARIPGARVEVQQGQGHFAAVEILPQMLTWLTAAGAPSALAHPGPEIRTGADLVPGRPVALRAAR